MHLNICIKHDQIILDKKTTVPLPLPQQQKAVPHLAVKINHTFIWNFQ